MENTGVKGRVVYFGTNTGIQGLEVIAVDFDPIYEEDVLNSKSVMTDKDGYFNISYSTDSYGFIERNPDIVVRVYGPSLRLLYESPEFTDVKVAIQDVGTIEIHRNNVEGWLVTYATLDRNNGAPVWLTQGNKIETLIDGAKVFPELTKLVKGAQKSINLMNYRFAVDSNPITKFDEPFVQPKPGEGLLGERVQEILYEKARQIPVRVLVWDFNAEAVLGTVAALVASGVTLGLSLGAPLVEIIFRTLFGAAGGLGIGGLVGEGMVDSAKEVKEYFKDSSVETHFFTSLWAIMHARVVVIDETTALVMGSSITRGYFSDSEHLIHDARHGGSLTHDVSLKVTGPAVEHLDRTFTTIWNQSGSSGSAHLQPAIGQSTVNEPGVAGIQVLRTLPGDTFEAAHTQINNGLPSIPKVVPGKGGIPAGETGVLEAYQRAIALAEDFIYIEDQYLTSPEIVSALISRMNKVPNLQLIIVLNPETDIRDYRQKQIDYVKQIQAKVTDNKRIRVFTLWSCQETTAKLEIMPISIHSKVAIIDDKWATAGTANLDGASMNQIETITMEDKDNAYLERLPTWVIVILLPILPLLVALAEMVLAVTGEIVYRRPTQHANPERSTHPSRFVDLNLVIYNGVAGQPATDFIKEFRKELWGEHLGLPKQNIADARPQEGWLKLWDDQALAKLNDIKMKKKHPAKVLEWKPETDSEKYLRALGIKTGDLCIRKDADQFEIDKSAWKELKPEDKCTNK